jgi:hypothetical protein
MHRYRSAFLLAFLISLATAAGAQDLPWRLTRIPAPNPAYGLFGSGLALSGDTLVIGGLQKTKRNAVVYIYVRHRGGWAQQTSFTLSNPHQFNLPPVVSISGDTLAVGLMNEDAPDFGAGAVYIYTRANGAWTRQARVTGDGGDQELFGSSVSVSGDTLAVGAQGGRRGEERPGAVYVFRRSGSAWRREAKLSPASVANGADLGSSVSLVGDRLAAGAVFDHLNSTTNTGGSALVFVRQGTTWTLEARFTGDPGVLQFGTTVSLSATGRKLAVGAPAQQAYVYDRSTGTWHLEARLTRGADPAATGFFGFFVAVTDQYAVVFGNRQGPQPGTEQAGAYLFQNQIQSPGDGTWANLGLLDGTLLSYGPNVVIEGDTIALGSPREGDSGEVRIYTPLSSDVDLALRILAPEQPLEVGRAFFYRTRIFNTGANPAEKVVLSFDLPPRVTLLSAQPERGACSKGDPVICRVGTIAPGESVLVKVLAYGTDAGAQTATAVVDASRPDAHPEDNTATAETVFILTASSAACGTGAPSCDGGDR